MSYWNHPTQQRPQGGQAGERRSVYEVTDEDGVSYPPPPPVQPIPVQQAPPFQPAQPFTPPVSNVNFTPSISNSTINTFADSISNAGNVMAQGITNTANGIANAVRRGMTRMVRTEVVLGDDGNFVVEVPVAKALLKDMPYNETSENGEEFTHLRYTAATVDANEFSEKYTLRAKKYGRKTRIAVVVTMYNEEDVLFSKTFMSIMKNIAYLCSGKVAGWSKDSWKEIVVCVVADGRAKCPPKTLNVMKVMGIYMDDMAKASVNGEEVKAHIFEFTNQVAVKKDLTVVQNPTEGDLPLTPCQTIFLLKEKNAKKINSHRWFFKAICDSLDPEITILIDCGTKATKESFFHIYNAFESNPRVGGACGEIAVELGPYWKNLLNPVVAIQNFEYKMSNILDKPLESVFGYISVLPGAFSAYRYSALQGKPLDCYFKGENPHGRNIQEANMYLAEDRILCFELAMKESEPWLLQYVKSARAETDVPSSFDGLIKQRRRWLNGAFFVQVHAIANWMRIFRSAHSTPRKWILFAEFVYNCMSLFFSWFNLGNFFLTFYFLFAIASTDQAAACTGGVVDSKADPFFPHGGTVFGVLTAVYSGALVGSFIASMGNRPEASRVFFITFAVVFALLMLLMLFMGIWSISLSINAYETSDYNHHGVGGFTGYINANTTFRDMVVSTLSTFGLYLFASLLHLEPWHMITCFIQYLLMVPSFINIIMVYSFCNLHDVSWGTRPQESGPALPPIVTITNSGGQTVATVELPSQDTDSDQVWRSHRANLAKEAAELKDRDKKKEATKTDDDDFYKQFRTNTLLLWMFSNALLVYIFTSPYIYNTSSTATSVNPYIAFLLWSIAVFSMIRFFFSTIYLVGWWADSLVIAGKRNILSGAVAATRQFAGN